MEHLGTILGIWAHPDDEAYLSGGLMATSAASGRRVVCVTATRGEAGSWDEERWPAAEMGRIREAELAQCLAILGVTEHFWLDYLDGTCDQVTDDEGAKKVSEIVEAVRPDTVLTFGPEGMTGHPDHIAVHRWATLAFERSAKPGANLFYAVARRGHLPDDMVERFRAMSIYSDSTPLLVDESDLAIDYRMPAEVLTRKIDALKAQVSQVEPVLALFGDEADAVYELVNSEEHYVLGQHKN